MNGAPCRGTCPRRCRWCCRRGSAACTTVTCSTAASPTSPARGGALVRYERENGEPLAYLSDLVPDYLPDPSVFHCPADASPGSPGSSGLPADPHQPISYFYELNPEKVQQIGVQLGPEPPGADASWRERK